MNVETHPHPPDEQLAAFGAGKLEDAALEVVASHLEACPECRAKVESQRPDSFVGKVQLAKPESSWGRMAADTATSDASGGEPEPAKAAVAPPELANHPKYAIRKQLGRGGMGTVYLAHDRDLDRDVAIKVMSPDLLARANALERFLQEAKSAARLPPHPNAVQVYSLERAGPLQLIVMEYVPGVDLEKYVRTKGPLPIVSACILLKQAAMGLQHAFEHGLVHRDIKPNNLVVNPKGQLKILDFGLAKPAGLPGKAGLTGDQAIMGTVEYMAPEQAVSARDVDIRADLYSLGCTAYFLLTGRPPFVDEGGNAVATLMAHQADEPTPLGELRPDVPTDLAAIVAKLLAKLPQDRFQRPVDLAQALLPFVRRPDGGAAADRAGRRPGVEPPVAATPRAETVRPVDTSQIPSERPAEPERKPTAMPKLAFSPRERPRTAGVKPPRKWPRRPIVALGGFATLLLVGIVLYVETGSGTIKIELSDPSAKVEVLVDGTIMLTDLEKPYRLKAGEHGLVVSGEGFETVTTKFTVKRGAQEPVRVTLVRRPPSAPPPSEQGRQTATRPSESAPTETSRPSTTSAVPDPNKHYLIVNRNSGKTLSFDGDSRLIQVNRDAANPAQHWKFIGASDRFLIKNRQSGNCIRVPQESRSRGVQLVQRQEFGGPQERWRLSKFEEHYRIQSAFNDMFVAVTNSQKQHGAWVIQWTANHGREQDWELVEIKESAAFVPLFHGEDASGWRASALNKGGQCAVESGVLKFTAPEGGVASFECEGVFADFHLRAELLDGTTNNKIFAIRTNLPRIAGYLIGTGGTTLAPMETLAAGALAKLSGTDTAQRPHWRQPSRPVALRPNDWYLLEIIARGRKITIRVEDQVVEEFEDPGTPWESGRLVIQFGGPAELRLRKLEFKSLTGE